MNEYINFILRGLWRRHRVFLHSALTHEGLTLLILHIHRDFTYTPKLQNINSYVYGEEAEKQERERETDRQTDRQTETERGTQRVTD